MFCCETGGIEIQKECTEYVKKNGALLTAQVYVSKSGRLPCKAVIHAVGPIWSSGCMDEKNLLYETIFNVLKEANRQKFTSVALPAISTGLYGFPLQLATTVILDAVKNFAQQPPMSVRKLREVHIIDQSASVILEFCKAAETVFDDVDDAEIVHVSASEGSTNKATVAQSAATSRPSKSHA